MLYGGIDANFTTLTPPRAGGSISGFVVWTTSIETDGVDTSDHESTILPQR
jgi:hypothetical protein